MSLDVGKTASPALGGEAGAPATALRHRIDTRPDAIAALPSLEALRVHQEILEAAEELVSSAEGPGLSRYWIEMLVRLVLSYHLQKMS